MKIILIGHRGSGKTTLSEYLNKNLNMPILRRFTDKPPKGHDSSLEYNFINTQQLDDLVKQKKVYLGHYKKSRFAVNRDLPNDYIACLTLGEILSITSEYKNEEFFIIYTYLEKDELRKRLLARGLSIQKANKTIAEDCWIIDQIKKITKINEKVPFRFCINNNTFTFIPQNTSAKSPNNILEKLDLIKRNNDILFYDFSNLDKLLNIINNFFSKDVLDYSIGDFKNYE